VSRGRIHGRGTAARRPIVTLPARACPAPRAPCERDHPGSRA
jgi:hypothetical protein